MEISWSKISGMLQSFLEHHVGTTARLFGWQQNLHSQIHSSYSHWPVVMFLKRRGRSAKADLARAKVVGWRKPNTYSFLTQKFAFI